MSVNLELLTKNELIELVEAYKAELGALRIYRKDKEHQEFMDKLKAKRGY